MSQKSPESRPALRKSADAAIHPALGGRPRPVPVRASSTKGSDVATRHVPESQPLARPLGKAKRATNSDVLRPSKNDPAVTIKVTVPKSLRKLLRSQAKALRITPEDLAARILADGLRER